MELSVKVFDKALGGKQLLARELRLVSQQLTALQIIEHRVDAEIADQSGTGATKTTNPDSLLVIPTFVEAILNGRRSYGQIRELKPKQIDRAKQIEVVAKAFTENQLLMLVDNKQITSLDQKIGFSENSTVTFIKLVPLIGG